MYESDRRYKTVLEFEHYVRQLAKDKDIQILGSFDPKKYNLNGTHFYDGMHLKRKAVAAILSHDQTISGLENR